MLASISGPRASAAVLVSDGDWSLRWDNTLRYNASFRLLPRDAALTADLNADDGDRNFTPGLISNRLDLFSEFDVSHGSFGVALSAAAWYDTVYHGRNSNNSPATFNPYSVPHDRFTRAVEVLHGEDIDLHDAFAYGRFDAGDASVSFRVGRHTLLWGESLFFANNGIAAGQAPVDAIKAASEPQAEAKEIFLPVTQASVTVQLRPDLAFSFYDQFEWRRTRLPGSGSYFSDADFLDAGGERLIGADGYLYRIDDRQPPASGQFGASIRIGLGDVDFGLYAIRFNAKEPQIFLLPGVDADPLSWRAGDYRLVFPKGIEAYGASFSTYVGESAIAGEISARRNMPLVSQSLFSVAGGGGGGYAVVNAALVSAPAQSGPVSSPGTVTSYAVGNTLHAQLSGVSTLPPGRWWDSADLSAELAVNDLLDVSRNIWDLAPNRDRFAGALRAAFAPHYFQVLPGLDVSTPIGLGYDAIGRSSTDASMNSGTGDLELGVSATYHTVWEGSFTYTHFFGTDGRQPFADRDFISLSVQRTF